MTDEVEAYRRRLADLREEQRELAAEQGEQLALPIEAAVVEPAPAPLGEAVTGEPCCAEVGPLLVASGTSGRSWRCGSCGRLWSPEPTPPPEPWAWLAPDNDDDDPRWPT